MTTFEVKAIENDIILVAVRGNLDVYDLDKSERHRLEAVSPKWLIFDFKEVLHVDCFGIGLLIKILKRIREKVTSGSNVYIINMDLNVRKLFNITGLKKFFKVRKTLNDCLKEIRRN